MARALAPESLARRESLFVRGGTSVLATRGGWANEREAIGTQQNPLFHQAGGGNMNGASVGEEIGLAQIHTFGAQDRRRRWRKQKLGTANPVKKVVPLRGSPRRWERLSPPAIRPASKAAGSIVLERRRSCRSVPLSSAKLASVSGMAGASVPVSRAVAPWRVGGDLIGGPVRTCRREARLDQCGLVLLRGGLGRG